MNPIREISSRRGSALLIVLGMFAFMLVSAVSFSIYMRASRAPSSYVRRNSAARHLVKAAVARAMDEIDCAIGNDPFPGVGYNHDYGSTGINQGDRTKNDNWHGRVFTPSNEVAHAETVSTLTLEALGYLPPCIINEVRYWSRHTRTAKWRSFNYGLGQYAFTAVNVSDFFDLNQFIDADGEKKHRLNRSSSEHGRISPTYLFRTGSQGDMNTGHTLASAFLNAMSDGSGLNGSPSIAEVPLVSMMDFNLALAGKSPGGIVSPFMERLNGSSGTFYSSVGDEVVRRQVFMAGGWNSDTNLDYNAYSKYGRVNLQYPEYQPFEGCDLSKTSAPDAWNANNSFWQTFNNYFSMGAQLMLWDYLDYDSVPVSLVLPNVEAIPMITGVELNPNSVQCSLFYTPVDISVTDPATGITKKRERRVYKVTLSATPEVTVSSVFPFVLGADRRDLMPNYRYEALVRIFLMDDSGDNARHDKESHGALRLSNDAAPLGLTGITSWPNAAGAFGDGVAIQIPLAGKPGKVKDAAQKLADDDNASESLDKRKASLVEPVPLSGKGGADFIVGVIDWEWDDTASSWKELKFYDKKEDSPDGLAFRSILKGDGRELNDVYKYDDKAPLRSGKTYYPTVAVWVRIVDEKNNKTVDLVPAIIDNDRLNGSELPDKNFAGNIQGDGLPMLRFFPELKDGVILDDKDFPADTPTGSKTYDWVFHAYMADDPRYNWNPEDWAAVFDYNDYRWIEAQEENDEFFMQVSNQGYLQSIYEFMQIPQISPLKPSKSYGYLEENAIPDTGVLRIWDEGLKKIKPPMSRAHANLMWRTYRADGFYPDAAWGSLDALPFEEPLRGNRVNPYTDIPEVMLGAFANMPRDWWAAGTNWNDNTRLKDYMKDNKEFIAESVTMDSAKVDEAENDDYVLKWSLKYPLVSDMARYWMGYFSDRDLSEKLHTADAWKKMFSQNEGGFDWVTGELRRSTDDTVTNLEKIMARNMTLADRKFLYGYLKGCFANTHQLFLLFVRAESAAGGGGAGSGARAVALVWRDPNAPSKNGKFVKTDGGTEDPDYGKDNAGMYLNVQSGTNEEAWRFNQRRYPPHKMRVLFYKQLD